MTVYAKVENGVVVSTGELPVNYKNVSGFNGLDNANLKLYGFYPLEIVEPAYDDKTHKLNGLGYSYGADKVTYNYEVVPLSADDLAKVEANKWARIRQERNRLLAYCDWSQLADAPIAADKKAAYANYRKALRDLPQVHAKADDVVWPATVA